MAVTVEISDHFEQSEPEKQELVCGTCGYGIVVMSEPPAFPMCRSSTWKLLRRASRVLS